MNKAELRKVIRERKRSHSIEDLMSLSQPVVSRLLSEILAQDFRTILLYYSLPDEVCTHRLVETLDGMGKTVLLPTVVGDDLELRQYAGPGSMAVSNPFGIQESTGALFTDYHQIELAVIPGVAFTLAGERLGRGKGFYDRLLPHLHCPLIGLAFPFQMVESIPCEPHDVRMTRVIC